MWDLFEANEKVEDEQALVEETEPPHTTAAFENFKLDFSKYPLTYMKASEYKGPVVEGWPPERNRSMGRYIRPNEDTFLMRPTLEAVKNCQMLIIGKSEKNYLLKKAKVGYFFLRFQFILCPIFSKLVQE